MSKKKFDIAIAYRIYPKVSKVPPVFSDDKYKLSELCLKSLAGSLKGLSAKIWVLLDNCPDEYRGLFSNILGEHELEFIELPGVGNNATFRMQADILLGQDDADIVYFAEDDYFYLPGRFGDMVRLITDKGADFVTPYDHPDYYSLDIHKYQSRVIIDNGVHWRTVSTTCMTFMARKSALAKTKRTFLSYSKRNDDASLWMSLTKKKIFNPGLYLKFLFSDFSMFKIMAKSWYFGWMRNLFGKKWELWSPVPSIATHMDSKYLAPGINWPQHFNLYME